MYIYIFCKCTLDCTQYNSHNIVMQYNTQSDVVCLQVMLVL